MFLMQTIVSQKLSSSKVDRDFSQLILWYPLFFSWIYFHNMTFIIYTACINLCSALYILTVAWFTFVKTINKMQPVEDDITYAMKLPTNSIRDIYGWSLEFPLQENMKSFEMGYVRKLLCNPTSIGQHHNILVKRYNFLWTKFNEAKLIQFHLALTESRLFSRQLSAGFLSAFSHQLKKSRFPWEKVKAPWDL